MRIELKQRELTIQIEIKVRERSKTEGTRERKNEVTDKGSKEP